MMDIYVIQRTILSFRKFVNLLYLQYIPESYIHYLYYVTNLYKTMVEIVL